MKVLQGVTVLDVTAYAFVPSAGGVLAHWGADVIKVESPKAPDPMRLMGGKLEPGRSSPMFRHYSRGKRSIGIDLATEEGQALVYRLAAKSDVFLTSYLAPTRRKLRIDVDDIRKANPNIVYARGSGQGPLGPDADRPGYDGLSWWYRGSLGQTAMDLTGDTWPTPMIGHGDGMSGMVLAGGICAALLHRAATAEAMIVDASLMGSAVWFNSNAILPSDWQTTERNFQRVERPPSNTPAVFNTATMAFYQTKDHRFIKLLFLGDDDRDFADLCQCVGRPELADDPRYTRREGRMAHAVELTDIFDAVFAARTFEDWKAALTRARGAWTPVQTPQEMFTDPQTIANGFIQEVEYPDGTLKLPTPPVMFDEDPGVAARAPDFAEHTDEILQQLGCTSAEISRLREASVIA